MNSFQYKRNGDLSDRSDRDQWAYQQDEPEEQLTPSLRGIDN